MHSLRLPTQPIHVGVLVIKPDFPEQKTDWPFLWFENEATVAGTSAYILAANAADALSH